MKVNLTSNISTYSMKVFWPLTILFSVIIFFYDFIYGSDFNENIQMYIVATIFFIAILYNSFRIKFVKGDNDFLYVKNYSKEIKVPLSELLKVNESRFPFRIINLEFKDVTEFGKKISFIPYSKWFLFGSDHPVLKELQNYVQNEKLKY